MTRASGSIPHAFPILSLQSARQVEHRKSASLDLTRQLRRLPLGDDQVFSPAGEVFKTVGQQFADMRDCVQNVIAIRTVNPIQLNVRIVDANLSSLADQIF